MTYGHVFSIAGTKKVYKFHLNKKTLNSREKKDIRLRITRKISSKYLVLHSTMISNGESCYLISGPSKSGKSTLSEFFEKNGYKILANDFVATWTINNNLYAGDINYAEINKLKTKSKIDRVIFLIPEDKRDVFKITKKELLRTYSKTISDVNKKVLLGQTSKATFEIVLDKHICLGNRNTPQKWYLHLLKGINWSPKKTVGIVGAGTIGQDLANLLVGENWLKRINLYSRNNLKLRSVVLDLKSANPKKKITIHKSPDTLLKNSNIVVICFNSPNPSTNINLNNERFNKASANAEIVKHMFSFKSLRSFMGTILVVTNPVDILASTLLESSNFALSSHQIYGVGLGLDYNRVEVKKQKDLDVVGEHGDNVIIVRNKNNRLYLTTNSEISNFVKNYSLEIRKHTERTRFGPVHETLSIIKSVLDISSPRINRVSTQTEFGYLGSHIVIKDGIPETITKPSKKVKKLLQKTKTVHRQIIDNL